MIHTALIPWLDPNVILGGVFGPVALIVVCAIVFAETGLLIGFLLPGDTLLFFTGVLAVTGHHFGISIWWICMAISLSAFLGGEVGYLIGHKLGPKVFERKETGLFSVKNVERTNAFFHRYGGIAVVLARFVPIVRTFAPVAAGVGHMSYRKYSLYNLVGAMIWGFGVTFAGYGLGQIEFVREFAIKYIDLVLLAVIALSVLPSVWHYFRAASKARKNASAHEHGDAAASASGHDGQPSLALGEDVFAPKQARKGDDAV